jgi:hypothetical protein
MENASVATPARSIEVEQEVGQKVETGLMPELQARIAMRAYQLYEESGYVPGRDMENWLLAEHEVLTDDMG